ncbi:hypothetical protein [Gynuella sunshinyii]|uniref:Uncharacterized protein n=1 Tax=Gynuella sunshinyii YC6258 TaxID=1445510 RepID=A0A0C5VQA1_9GAMM|nr:hypothetical protein [Gynuella sunshinyii]AJQ96737.1 hypothetical Protein YC6258_04705 [Gynuella sunshinyii YC6258]
MFLTALFSIMVMFVWLLIILGSDRENKYFGLKAGRLFQWGLPTAVVMAISIELLHFYF